MLKEKIEHIISTEESYKIQILRGLAIIAVVYIHCLPPDFSHQVCVRPFLNFSVGLFLFLSGFLSYKVFNRKKRILKVIVPYIIWTIFYMTIRFFYSGWEFEKFILQLIKAFFTASSAAMMYYILVYIQVTLLLSLIDRIAFSKFKFLPFLLVLLEIVLVRLAPILGWYDMGSLTKYLSLPLSVVPWLGYFYLGYLLRNNQLPVKIKTDKFLFYLIVAIIIQFFEGWYYYSKNIVNCGTQLKLSSILTGLIFCCITYKGTSINIFLTEIPIVSV